MMESPKLDTTTLLASNATTSFWRRSAFDWGFAAFIAMMVAVIFREYGAVMGEYEIAILMSIAPCMVLLGWMLKGLRYAVPIIAGCVVIAIKLYAGNLANAEHGLLKVAFGSQSAILLMGVCFWLATLVYWLGFFTNKTIVNVVASALTWVAFVCGFVGLLVRWHESHLLGGNVGYIPVSNLYEVVILFSLITAGFYLYYEQVYNTRQLGGFVLLVISAAIGFIFWYAFARNNAQIQPLVPALQSWWMKIHVPANFVGYGTFSLAAMVALASLVNNETAKRLWTGLIIIPFLVLLLSWAITYAFIGSEGMLQGWQTYQNSLENPSASVKKFLGMVKATKLMLGLLAVFLMCVVLQKKIQVRLPSNDILNEVMYRAIVVGFVFFMVAIILGALWARDSWGRYWGWDPKETWAFIVWINYAAWLHIRLISGGRGNLLAWWALVGLLVTSFAFLGVNMFLSGLHSYGGV